MEKICKNLSTIKAPFNCPHGRPTIFEIELSLSEQA